MPGPEDNPGGPQAPAVWKFLVVHLGADLLAQDIDGHHLPLSLEPPISPAIAGWGLFKMRPNLMDRSFYVMANQRAVGADFCDIAARRIKFFARAQHPTFNKLPKGHPRLCALGHADLQRGFVKFPDLRNALLGHFAISLFAFDPDELAPQHFGHGTGRTCAEERIQHHIARVRRAHKHAMQQAFRLLRRMRLVTVVVF